MSPTPVRRALQQQQEHSQLDDAQSILGPWQRRFDSLEVFQRQQQQQQRHLERPPSYLDSISAPPSSQLLSISDISPPKPAPLSSIPSLFSSDDPNDPPKGGEDITWLLIVVLSAALLISLVSIIRSCGQRTGWLSLSSSSDGHGAGHRSQGHGGRSSNGGTSRYPGHGPHQVPSEDEPDPNQELNENDERWALMTEAQRQAYDSSRAFQAAHPPLSVPTDISLSQHLSIQEKGVSAWEFEAPYDNHRVQVHDRTELSFPPMNQLEASVQTNLPMPKQQEVYYWEVKMFEKSPDTVVSVGVSTKPYPNIRLPGWTRHSVAYFSKDGQKYCNSPFSGHPYGPIYFEGDVIGCGYRPRTGTIFFTRNGKRLEDAYTGLKFNLFPTVGATGPCILHVNLGQSGFVFVEANVKKWGLAPANGSLIPPPAYGSERGSILLEAGSTMSPTPPMRRPNLQSSQSRARIEAAGVLVQIDDDDAGESGGGSEYGKKVIASVTQQHISLSNMSVPTNGHALPPHYSSVIGGNRTNPGVLGAQGSESDDETTALIAETISRPVGRGRSGTTNSIASGSGTRR
ncbi:concanavalin A-like lectin/glucanase domain-containing protein [Lobosporangium transversale]|uniref:Concanavalin A-like lectin/glucanase domain-containing protein n=1 Tax=Lobosporangium transversale TaxID=64571 RepID=A0A1Y2GC48_9FUNG|nr:concanavalin A-like lectin/glucanase domain-containing protein [Lobosporangium transversale]ORZ05486.1 concanavalin A-like lectin/glucanase domain-containing protein [Lobosporangium transversale]|eukprot:XP_021877060.1 concanavalin A-like lectin/glucanase domain-containing protein [Lobosporangium transversale]